MSGRHAMNDDSERFVRALAAAVPEVFVDVDLAEEYGPHDVGPYLGLDQWMRAGALEDAAARVATLALEHDASRPISRVRPGGGELLHRFFDFVEAELEVAGLAGWMEVAIMEGGEPWMEDLGAYAGPLTLQLMPGEYP